MFTRPELMKLRRQLKSTPTLSVYLSDGADDPAQRGNGRRTLLHRFAHLRDALRDAPPAERAALDRAIEQAEICVEAIPVSQRFDGWVAFVTEQGVQHIAMLPVEVPTDAVWHPGLWISPYLRALDHQGTAVVSVADSRMATVYRYRDGALTHVALVEAEAPEMAVSHMGAPPQPGFHSGTRGRTGSDEADRVHRDRSARLARTTADQLYAEVAPGELVLVGGIPAMAHAIVSELLVHEGGRARVLAGLDVHATPAAIVAHVEPALDAWRDERQHAVLHDLTEAAMGTSHTAFGVPDTLAALKFGAVARLVLTEDFEQRDRSTAEAAVQLACDGDAQVTYLRGAAAAQLEARGAGMGARLRFPVPHATTQS